MLHVKIVTDMLAGLTWQHRQSQAALLSDGHHLVLLLTMATVGHCQPLSACKQNVFLMKTHSNYRKK